MTTFLNKSLLAAAAVGAIGLCSTSVSAASVYPDFTVNPTSYYAAPNFVADKITGNYTETITLNANGSFSASIAWVAGQFVANDGTTALTALQTGLGSTYNIFALFQGNGFYAPNASGGFTLTLDPTSASALGLQVYIDPYPLGLAQVNTFTAPTDGTTFYTSNPNGPADVLIAKGAGLNGSGNSQVSGNCAGGINCGSFGQLSSFNLQNPGGTSFFVLPDPFYSLSFQSGQFNLIIPGAPATGSLSVTSEGSMDVVFTNVPEPGSLALLGVGLLGLGLSKRNKKS